MLRGYELALSTSWLGYELARYELEWVRVDWKPNVLTGHSARQGTEHERALSHYYVLPFGFYIHFRKHFRIADFHIL